MKKIFLSLALLTATVMSYANPINIINLTGCSYFVALYAGQGEVYVTPGYNNSFADPSQVPNSTAPSTATFTGASIIRDGFPDGFGVGDAPAPQSVVSGNTSINDYPTCYSNTGLPYTVSWIGGNGNPVVLLIF